MKRILSRIKSIISNRLQTPSDTRILALINLLDNGSGHKLSYDLKKPVNAIGLPVPWFTYPAIDYINQIDMKNMSVLEWGTGNSTIYFAARCKDVLSVEHDKKWHTLIFGQLPDNAESVLVTEDEYANFPSTRNKKFDIIVVDGINRGDCIDMALKVVSDKGLIIFDNSERNPELCENIRNYDFIQVDFHGLGPINPYAWTTTFFFSRKWTAKPLTFQPQAPYNNV